MPNQQLSTNTFTTAKWIVSPTASDGTHTTIASAIASASSGDTIFIRPNVNPYTENFTLPAGITLSSFGTEGITGSTIILGKITITSGKAAINGIQLKTNSDNCLALTGSGSLNLFNCFISVSNNTAISMGSSGFINMYNCQGNIGTTGIAYFTMTAGSISIFNGIFTNSGSSTTANTTSGGSNLTISQSVFPSPISTTGASTGIVMFFSTIQIGGLNTTCLTTNGTGTNLLAYSEFESGTASTISIGTGANTNIFQCTLNSSNTNVVTGAGQVTYTPIFFNGSSSVINTTTQTPANIGPRVLLSGGCQILAGAGSPNGAVTAPQGSLWLSTNGSSGTTRAFINTNSGTAWTAIDTVA